MQASLDPPSEREDAPMRGSSGRVQRGTDVQHLESWLAVELRHFVALEAIAAERSFRRAAARLGYTQPAVSQQLAALERVVGARLVNRGRGSEPVTLTAAGERLLDHALAIRARISAAQIELAALKSGRLGVVRVGIYQTIATCLLPEILRQFGDRCPEVELKLMDAPGDREILAALARDDLDAAFADLPLSPEEPFHVEEFLADEYTVVVAAASKLFAGREAVEARDLVDVPLIAYAKSGSTDELIAILRKAGTEPRFVLRSDDNLVVQALANADYGAAILPRLAIVPGSPVRVLPFADPMPPRVLGLASRVEPSSSPSLAALVEAVHAAAASVRIRSSGVFRHRVA